MEKGKEEKADGEMKKEENEIIENYEDWTEKEGESKSGDTKVREKEMMIGIKRKMTVRG